MTAESRATSGSISLDEHGLGPSVVCIGETMAQVVPADTTPIIDAVDFRVRHGGAESNVALQLARLGDSVAWVSRLGTDALGARILRALAAEGIGLSGVRLSPTQPTGVYFKDPSEDRTVSYYRKGSAASGLDTSDIDVALALGPRVVHLSGITPALSESCQEATTYALDTIRRSGYMRASFDVNYRAQLWSNAADAAVRLGAMANMAHIVFVGLDEATELWGVRDAEQVRALLPEPDILVVKDGSKSATSFSNGSTVTVPAIEVEVVEPVGAGDAFAAGWLHGFLHDLEPTSCLRLGHLIAGAALSSVSDHGDLSASAAEFERLAADTVWPPAPQNREM